MLQGHLTDETVQVLTITHMSGIYFFFDHTAGKKLYQQFIFVECVADLRLVPPNRYRHRYRPLPPTIFWTMISNPATAYRQAVYRQYRYRLASIYRRNRQDFTAEPPEF